MVAGAVRRPDVFHDGGGGGVNANGGNGVVGYTQDARRIRWNPTHTRT